MQPLRPLICRTCRRSLFTTFQTSPSSTASKLLPSHAKRSHRSYQTSKAPEKSEYPPIESAILSAAKRHIPEHGFTHASLVRGAQDAGYLPVTTNVFPNGAFDLVKYYLVSERLALGDRLDPTVQEKAGVTQRIRHIVLARLHSNEPIVQRLPEMFGQMSLAGNIPASLAELSRLVDEMWYLSGDRAVDNSWYSKRALLAGVYASAEVFMMQDRSPAFAETDQFVERRLQDVGRIGYGVASVTEWVGFTGTASVNVLRSWGVRV